MNFPKVKVKRHWLDTLKAAKEILHRTDTVASAVMLAAVKTRDSMTAEEVVKSLLDSVRPFGSFTFWMGASLAPAEERQKLREDWLDSMIEECEALVRQGTINAKLAELKSQHDELGVRIGFLEAGLREAGLKDLMAAKAVVEVTPDKWKVYDLVKCVAASEGFEVGKLYGIADINSDCTKLRAIESGPYWASVKNFKFIRKYLLGDSYGTHSR